MKSITIHGVDGTLDRLIREKASNSGLSINKTVKKLLRVSLGISKNKRKYADFSEFFGVWSEKEYKEFQKAIKDSERIDPEDWK